MKKLISVMVNLAILFTMCSVLPINAAKNMGYAYPVPGVGVFQKYKGANHAGIDISTSRGTAIYATKSGTVIARYEGCYNDNGYDKNGVNCSSKRICDPSFNTKGGFCNDGFGNGFIIKHDDNTWSSYGHLQTLAGYQEGSYVEQGAYLGGMGSSGKSTGSHLHFEIRTATTGSTINDYWNVAKHVNPMDYMDIDDRGQAISDGMYIIKSSVNTKYALTVADASTDSRANVRIETSGNKKSQKFNIRHIAGGYYTITNINSGKVLDAESGGTASGTNVWQYNLNNTDAQLWKIKANSDKTYTFVNKKSGLCLDLSGGEAKNKQNVQIYTSNSSAAQKWFVEAVKDDCLHTAYTAYGYCKSCGLEYPSLTIGGTVTGKIIKDKTPVRLRPYSAEKTLYTLKTGTSVTVVGYAFNSYHNVWYKTNSGEWIYSGNIELPALNNVNMGNTGVSFNTDGTPRIKMTCSYTGTRPSEVGAYVGTTKANMQKFASDTINFSKNPFDVWYDISNAMSGRVYYYQFYSIVNGVVKVSEIKTFLTEGYRISDPIASLGTTVTISDTTKITTTTARVNGRCSYTGARPTEVGLKIGYAENALVKVASDTINFSKNPFDIWYDLTDLKANTKYYYALYAIVNGAEVVSDIGTFTTANGAVSDAVSALPSQNLKLTVNAVSKLTKNTARVNASCSYSGTRPTEVGLYIGTDSGNLKKYGSDVIDFTKNPFDIWYDLTGLNPGTTYYYKVYAIVNGQVVWSTLNSFTTANGTVSAVAGALPEENTRTGVVTGTNGDNLAINDKAAASPKYSNEIGVIPPGAQMTVYPDKAVGNWYYVTYNGISGYAYGKYITLK